MKRLYWLIPAALLLTACDRKSAPDAFTPEMASFSNEFEFDPLRGPVKILARRCWMNTMWWSRRLALSSQGKGVSIC